MRGSEEIPPLMSLRPSGLRLLTMERQIVPCAWVHPDEEKVSPPVHAAGSSGFKLS